MWSCCDLAAYWLPFEADHSTHHFLPDTSFEKVLQHYVFDRELRLVLIDAIERVEVAVRTQFAFRLSHVHGSHFLLNPALFQRGRGNWSYTRRREELERETLASKETFMRHLTQKYSESLPPVWAAVEIMTLGQLSMWYANLLHNADRNRIARAFGFDEIVLVSFLHHLAIVRNLCAHHSRVWNREFAFTFKLPRHRPAAVVPNLNPDRRKNLYNTLVLLTYLLDTISPGHHWKQRLIDLIGRHGVSEDAMGFPSGWRNAPFWQ